MGLRRSSEDASEGMEKKIKSFCTGKGQVHMIVHVKVATTRAERRTGRMLLRSPDVNNISFVRLMAIAQGAAVCVTKAYSRTTAR